MTTIRWGMIGCGDVTEVKSGPGFAKARDSSLVAVMRRDGRLAEDYARRHGVPRWHDDADAIIRAPDIDAVYVATLTDSHCEYTLRCAAAGKPVYVEKPMGMDHGECVRMVDACRAYFTAPAKTRRTSSSITTSSCSTSNRNRFTRRSCRSA